MKSKTLSLRVDRSYFDLLAQVAQSRGEDVSSMVRRAILKELACLSYLDPDTKKALGVVVK